MRIALAVAGIALYPVWVVVLAAGGDHSSWRKQDRPIAKWSWASAAGMLVAWAYIAWAPSWDTSATLSYLFAYLCGMAAAAFVVLLTGAWPRRDSDQI